MDKNAIDLAAALAGQVNRDLQEVPNRKPINPTEFLQKAGVPMHSSQVPVRAMNYPGMIDAPKSTPMGSEVLSTTADMPALIPMPAELQKYVDGDPQLDPNVVTPTVTAPIQQPVHAPASGSISLSDVVFDIQQRIIRMEQLLDFTVKRLKYKKSNKSKKKTKVINETSSTPISGSGQTHPTTPGSTNQTT